MSKDTLAKKLFHGRCPYTDKHCDSFDCLNCEVEQQEREYMEQLDYDEDSEGGLISEE